MSTPSIVHSTFVVERTYPASGARVFAAFSNPAIKRRWFAEGRRLADRRIHCRLPRGRP
jgi:uncharacterized protein YndB with AHSA1/START domain